MGALFDDWRARSPFYDEQHDAIAESVRRFIAVEATPHIDAWERAGEVPVEFNRKAGAAGLLGLGFPEEWRHLRRHRHFPQPDAGRRDRRAWRRRAVLGVTTHMVALPPILALGSDEMKRRIAPPVIAGEKIMALAITEPSGGSDVARLRTRAERLGDEFVVNGSKTFISSGMRADYFTVAVRTGGSGLEGISLLLIEKDLPGFRVHRSTRWAGTAPTRRRSTSRTFACRSRT